MKCLQSWIAMGTVLSFLVACRLDKPKDQTPMLLALLLLSNNRTLQEPRPFRGRSIFYESGNTARVYEWNLDRNLNTLDNVSLKNGNSVWVSDSGRFVSYIDASDRFQILDSGFNLSPHGDHYHVDRSTPTTSFIGNSLDRNPNPHVNALANPGFAISKNNTFSYLASGRMQFVTERRLVVENPPNSSLLFQPNDSQVGVGVAVSETKAIRTNSSNDLISLSLTGSTWSSNNAIASSTNCPNPSPPVFHQIPVAGTSFANLNAISIYNHTILFPCTNRLIRIRYTDGGSYTLFNYNLSGKLNYLIPQFRNRNYSQGGRDTKPVFFGNFGTTNETTVVKINGESDSTQSFTVPAYSSTNLISAYRTGEFVVIFHNDSVLRFYSPENFRLIQEIAIPEANGQNPVLYGDWDSGFLLYGSGSGTVLQEINIPERWLTRKVSLDQRPTAITFHAPRGRGADSERSPH